MEKIESSKWIELWLFFKRRSGLPFQHPEFILYFALVVIGFGASGVWTGWIIESEKETFNHMNMVLSFSSYAVALLSTGSVELMFHDDKVTRRPIMLISISLIVLSLLALILCLNISPEWGYRISVSSAIVALVVWWIANAENLSLTKPYYQEQSDTTKELNEELDEYAED
ncbi:MAG: hypothetical protein JKX84_07285 [Flavobacteriales bacterium]|nr:hypothetical protein [Flavobacteriales bacterium]